MSHHHQFIYSKSTPKQSAVYIGLDKINYYYYCLLYCKFALTSYEKDKKTSYRKMKRNKVSNM